MRSLLLLALVACSNDVDPRVIPGGGIGDGEIDGEVNVHVIDGVTDAPIGGATVAIGSTEKKTDAKGLVVFEDVEGPQTIAVKALGYRSTVMVDANGANVTFALPPDTATSPQSATLSGSIANWSMVSVPQGHIKGAIVFYSHSSQLGDAANDLQSPPGSNVCGGPGADCNWSVVTRTGKVTVIAFIIDRDTKNNLDPSDDTNTVIGYAYKSDIMVEGGVNQSGLSLTQVEAGNLETITIDEGTPPAALTEVISLVGIEISADEVIQLPLFVVNDGLTHLVPKRSVFGPDATYQLTAIAQTTSGEDGAQSIIVRKGLTTATLAAGTWLGTATGVTITRTSASFEAVAGASAYSVKWEDANGKEVLEITLLNKTPRQIEVPPLVALPTSGALVARAQAIGADLDLNDFSMEEDSDLIWGFSAQPVNIP